MSCQECGCVIPSLNTLLCMSESHCILCKKSFCYTCQAPEKHNCSFGNKTRIQNTKQRLNEIKEHCNPYVFSKFEEQLSKIENFYQFGKDCRMKDREYKVNKFEGFFKYFEVFEMLELSIYIIEMQIVNKQS